MALKRIRLGDYILPLKEKCGIRNLDPYEVSGVNRDKEFFEPSKQIGEDTSNYQNVPPRFFACNLMHVGRDKVLPIAYNHTNYIKHVSPAYTVFRIKENDVLSEQYFFIYLKSDERDRFFWFNTDSSIRDGMTWDDLCNVELEVPDLSIQEKFVKVYLSMLENQKNYESGLEDLKLVCEAHFDEIRKSIKTEPIIRYLTERFETNKDGKESFMRGVGLEGFIEPNQERTSNSLKKCNIFYKGDFVYAPSSFKNGVISYNEYFDKALCSEEYIVFKINDEEKLNPYYLLMCLKRKQLGLFIDFSSCDSVRNRFYFKDLDIVEIPVPSIEFQRKISAIYKCYLERKEINEKLKAQINNICPILIKGSIEEAKEV